MPEMNETSVLAKTEYSALSTGTELMLLRKRIDAYLGYSGTGIVTDVGPGVTNIRVGQRVACYGVPTHAEYFLANKHHVTIVPDHVDPQEAAFAGIGSIAVQALRQADLRFGETVVVLGLGILGQLAGQIARAAAYRVIAADLMEDRCLMAVESGINVVCRTIEEVSETVRQLTGGYGADCVLICASSKSERLIDKALEWIRDRGKVVIVGDTNTEFERDALFAKEASITVSRAGGPGRYDPSYEKEGRDYPYGYVRWTLHRNLCEFIRLLSEGLVRVKPLITGIYELNDIDKAYQSSIHSPQTNMGTLIQF